MKSIQKTVSDTRRELGSKFIGFVFYCENESSFHNQLSRIKKKYPDASHHCYAYRIHPQNLIEFSSDDGEPSGTAGLPVLNQLRSFDLVNAGAIVVRYFGGTKLGKSGLIQAYGGAIKQLLDESDFSELQLIHPFIIEYNYPEENKIKLLTLQFELKELESEYSDKVTKHYACKPEISSELEMYLTGLEYKGITFQRKESTFEII